MNIFFTLDRNYLLPLRVMLFSMLMNNPGESFHIYFAGEGFFPEDWDSLRTLCGHFDAEVHPVTVDERWFDAAPTFRYYSRAMYYRLLAAQMLPDTLDRILYLDPDMLVIGALRPLYDTELGDYLYAASVHRGLVDIATPVNKIRLSTQDADGYFNSGMLLMNLPEIRKHVHPQDIFTYVEQNRPLLVLPDQDVLNGLYGHRIMELDEKIYNYDARRYNEYLLASQGKADMDYVIANTLLLHFCGKKKPWNKSYYGRFGALYKHYMQLCARFMG